MIDAQLLKHTILHFCWIFVLGGFFWTYKQVLSLYFKSILNLYSCFVCRFDGMQFLRTWRGKKIMFVGDSLSLNMWESLSCMIHASVPNTKTSFVRKGTVSSATFQVRSISPFSLVLFVSNQPHFSVHCFKKTKNKYKFWSMMHVSLLFTVYLFLPFSFIESDRLKFGQSGRSLWCLCRSAASGSNKGAHAKL